MTTQQIQNLIDEAFSLQGIAQAFSEISAIKLRLIRSGIERNRQFAKELQGVFSEVKQVAKSREGISKLVAQLVEKNGKTISLLLTSNYRFYGDVNNQLVAYFIQHSSETTTDRLVLGKIGSSIMEALSNNLPYQSFTTLRDFPDQAELGQLVSTLSPYKRVLVYHSSFKTVLSQLPVITDVSASMSATSDQQNTPAPLTPHTDNPARDFILEPEVDKILAFFDSQILTLILEVTFLESELSRTASRLISMSNAQTAAQKYLKEQKKQLSNAKKAIQNARMLETFATFKNWQEGVSLV